MQILPVVDISKIALIGESIIDSSSPSKGKHKAHVDTGVQPERKKQTRRTGNTSKETEAMEVSIYDLH